MEDTLKFWHRHNVCVGFPKQKQQRYKWANVILSQAQSICHAKEIINKALNLHSSLMKVIHSRKNTQKTQENKSKTTSAQKKKWAKDLNKLPKDDIQRVNQ